MNSPIETMPLVSIVTPVYNGAVYIEELILSIKSQSYPNIEHIIINDGSQDNGATVKILKSYKHLRWWSRENRGLFATMNEGLDAATGQYICFIHADDLMAKDAVRCAIDWLITHQGFEGVYGLTNYISETGEPYPIKLPFRHAHLKYYPYFTQLQHCSLYISRQTLIDKQLFFNPAIRFVGDYDWILRMLKAGIHIGFIDTSLSAIRIHNNQLSAQNRTLMIKEQFEIAHKNGWGGIKFKFYINVLHIANFVEQLRYAFKKDRLIGVKKFMYNWVTCKLIPRIQGK